MEKIKSNIKGFMHSQSFLFFVCSLLFALSLTFKIFFGDDQANAALLQNCSLLDIWEYDLGRYFTWASRVLVNFFANVLIVSPNIIWQICMGASMYIMMQSLTVIFKIRDKNSALFICFITMLLPWQIYKTAGWIAASATYFIAAAVGVAAFIPIARAYRNEKSSAAENIFCTLALIFAANIEQVMAVALGIYLIADIYFIAAKKFRPILGTQLLVCILSAVYTFLCPGNEVRNSLETPTWFPTFPQLDMIDKADIGLFSTLNSLFVSDIQPFVIAVALVLTYLGFRKYKDAFYRVIFVLPSALLILLGPAYDSFTANIFPFIQKDYAYVSEMGLITPDSAGSLSSVFGAALMLGILMLILVCVILISDSVFNLVSNILILGIGLASRIAIGFSPTVYASSTRTFSVLYFCMLVFAVKIFTENIRKQELSQRELSFLSVFFPIVIIFSFVNLVLIP